MSHPMPSVAPAQIVTALLRNGSRLLLCHRSAQRRVLPDVWDLPGGHVEPGELPAASLVRELREELGIDVARPVGPPMAEVRAETYTMRIWLVETWTGTVANAAPEEHDAIGWFAKDELSDLRLAHDSYLAMFTKALDGHRDRPVHVAGLLDAHRPTRCDRPPGTSAPVAGQ